MPCTEAGGVFAWESDSFFPMKRLSEQPAERRKPWTRLYKRIRIAAIENGHISKDTEDSIKQRHIAALFQVRLGGQAT